MDPHNHQHFQHDLEFSGPGDIDRVTGDNTSALSSEANAQARAAERVPTSPRADTDWEGQPFPDHAYGTSP